MKKKLVCNQWFMKAIFMTLTLTPLLSVGQGQSERLSLQSEKLQLILDNSSASIHQKVSSKRGKQQLVVPLNTGIFNFIYSEQQPSKMAVPANHELFGKVFIDTIDRHAFKEFDKVLNAVSFNTAGTGVKVKPSAVYIINDTAVITMEHALGKLISKWYLSDYSGGTDIRITTTLIAERDGYYSLASPDILITAQNKIKWGMIPGYFQGNAVQPDIIKAYGYGMGIPNKPVIFRDRNAATLSSLLTRTDGITIAVTADPGTGRDPWKKDVSTHNDWHLGLSAMNRSGAITPTLYFPVLGEYGSYLKKGEQVSFGCTVTLSRNDWFQVLTHTVDDIYKFKEGLALRKNIDQSLMNRVTKLKEYVSNDKTSLWNIESYQGLSIGAQSYLGTVTGADKDAMKNSDYGAMWMLASITQDSVLQHNRLPYARNFKLLQQQEEPGFFKGASIGQYYLKKSRRFTEEWGNYVEPLSLTYYTMLDIGNILLFDKTDSVLMYRLRIGADRLLEWQHKDGSWNVAYNRSTEQPAFKDLRDYRPTFYGLLVAYRILKDEKYLKAARKGADWYLKQGVENGYFLGVCGDARYVPDFATVQTAQAYLDLYDLTGRTKYKAAAIKTAKMYVASIYTHPIPSMELREVKGTKKQEWQISQAGLGFEHGGNFGSSTTEGPILLAGHAGLFVRAFALTQDSLFLNMARAATIGRESFVNKTTNVASYYWGKMDNGAGPYPHHAWWQIGWIMDYVLAEAELRSNKGISFPRGFVTPKVGPHQCYGFEPGKIYGETASLRMYEGLLTCDNSNIELVTAVSENKIYIIALNDIKEKVTANISINGKAIGLAEFKKYQLNESNRKELLSGGNALPIKMEGYGLQVYTLEW